MLGETPDRNIRRSAQLSLLLKASLSQEELQIQTAEKAQRFEKKLSQNDPFWIFAILTIPLIFLILMFSLESKIVFLILWILSIILIATWLITVEYIHNELAAQQELSGMSFEEMLKIIQKNGGKLTMKNIIRIARNDIHNIRKKRNRADRYFRHYYRSLSLCMV